MTPGRRAFDLFIAALITPVVVPLIGIVALVIRLTDGRPVFYVAERMTTPTRGFRLLKFRTMTTAPDERGVSGGDKARRITRTGRTLRRFYLDELPQLWNLWAGHISVVGPRPPLPEYVERFPDLYARVLVSRPGLTGLASVAYGRHEARLLARCATPDETDALYVRACVPRKARLDLIHQRNRSLCFDLVLLRKTFLKR